MSIEISRGGGSRWWRRNYGSGEAVAIQEKSKLSFAKGTKLQTSRLDVEGMVVAESLPCVSLVVGSENIEWLADSSARKHICTDLSLMWDVTKISEPVGSLIG